MKVEIEISKYLSENEIKEIVKDEVKTIVRQTIGASKETQFVTILAKKLAKEGVQELIPNFEELINNHIKEQIKTVKLSDFFESSFGWSNTGNKILNLVLSENKELIDAKVKEIFAPIK